MLTPDEGFCPFRPPLDSETSDDEMDDDIIDEEDLQKGYKEEVDSLHKLLKMGIEKGGKCPFSRLPGEIEQRKKQSCPFDFGMKEDADSEEEADMPKEHLKNGRCPTMIHRREKEAFEENQLNCK